MVNDRLFQDQPASVPIRGSHPLHHAAGVDAVSQRIDRPVRSDVVDLIARHADVLQFPVTQVVQGGP